MYKLPVGKRLRKIGTINSLHIHGPSKGGKAMVAVNKITLVNNLIAEEPQRKLDHRPPKMKGIDEDPNDRQASFACTCEIKEHASAIKNEFDSSCILTAKNFRCNIEIKLDENCSITPADLIRPRPNACTFVFFRSSKQSTEIKTQLGQNNLVLSTQQKVSSCQQKADVNTLVNDSHTLPQSRLRHIINNISRRTIGSNYYSETKALNKSNKKTNVDNLCIDKLRIDNDDINTQNIGIDKQVIGNENIIEGGTVEWSIPTITNFTIEREPCKIMDFSVCQGLSALMKNGKCGGFTRLSSISPGNTIESSDHLYLLEDINDSSSTMAIPSSKILPTMTSKTLIPTVVKKKIGKSAAIILE